MTNTDLPKGLLDSARAYASRRAAREMVAVHIYTRGGIVFVRADYEPRPDDSILLETMDWR